MPPLPGILPVRKTIIGHITNHNFITSRKLTLFKFINNGTLMRRESPPGPESPYARPVTPPIENSTTFFTLPPLAPEDAPVSATPEPPDAPPACCPSPQATAAGAAEADVPPLAQAPWSGAGAVVVGPPEGPELVPREPADTEGVISQR